MKPLFSIVVTICVVVAVSASETESKLKEPVAEAESSEPQPRKERCTACSQNVKLNLGSTKDVLAALQQLPAGEVHTQQTFEGCSSEKGCAGIKVKDGQVVQRFGNLDAFNQAVAQDTNNEFTFHAAGSSAFDANGPFWWMNKDSPFKSSGGAYQKFSKTSSSYTSTGGGVDLSANPFLNGGFSKLGGFTSGGSSQYSGQTGFASQSGFGAQGFEGQGYTGSSPAPFSASNAGSNVNLIQNSQKGFGYEQNVDDAFQSTGNVLGSDQGDLTQTCSGQGYVCVPRSQCNNGVVNTNGANILQANTQKQYCNLRSEICCRIEVSSLSGSSGLQGSLGVDSATFSGSSQGSNLFGSGASQGNFASGFGSSSGSGFSSNSFGSGASVNRGSGYGSSGSSQSTFETDAYAAGSENVYRPGAIGLKPGIPYLPPVDSSNSPSNVVPSTVYPTSFVTTPRPFSTPRPITPRPYTTPRPISTPRPITPRPYTTPNPTYLPPVPSTSAPGYLPPVAESSIPRETVVQPPYSEGELILDQNRQPSPRPTTPRPFVPIQAPSEIPAGCAAALKCTPIEFCTAEGVISNTTVILTREQESYRVPLTDCKDIESGRIGKCCRDPFYTDPWPANQIGRWVPGVFGGNDGRYVPDSRGSPSTNSRPSVTARPPTTGEVQFPNYRTTQKPTVPAFVSSRVTPSFPATTVSPGVYTGQGQYGSQGVGQIGVTGVGQIGTGGRGQNRFPGPGQSSTPGYGSLGVGQVGSEGVGFGRGQGVGAVVTQGGGQVQNGGVGIGVTQGAYDQGFGQSVQQGVLTSQGVGVQTGTGFGLSQGSGVGVSQGFGTGVQYGTGQKLVAGRGQAIIQGEGQGVIQGSGYGIKNGGGYTVSQGGGYGVENEYSASTQRVFLQRYSGAGQCGLLNPQKPYGNRNELEVDFAEIPWQAMVLLQTNKSLLCGGVITRPEVVITSASCVDGLDAKNVLIKGGEWKLGIDDEPLPFQIVQVKTILRHPEYRRGSLKYDVAILVLNENLRFAKNIQPICLPSSTDTLDAFYNGAGECVVTGWGKSVLQAHLSGAIMHAMNVSLINPGECQAKLSSEYPHLLEQYDQDSCVCGQPTNPLNNICKVDIGSAMACTTGDSPFVLRGVYSWDSGCQIGNQIAGFYKFDLEWYEWAIGLIESVRFAKYTKVTQGKITQVTSTKTTQYSGIKNTGVKEVTSGGGANFGQFTVSGGSTKFGQTGQIGTIGTGKFTTETKSPVTKTVTTTYTSNSQFGTKGSGAQVSGGEGLGFGQLSGEGVKFGQGIGQIIGQGVGQITGQGLSQISGQGVTQFGTGKFSEGSLSFGTETKPKTITTTYTSNTSQFSGGKAGATQIGSGEGLANGFGQFTQVSGGGSKQFGQFATGGFTSGIKGAVNGVLGEGVSKGFGQYSQLAGSSGQSQVGLNFGTDIKPITNTFSATYSEKKVFQTEPKYVTYTTKPEIVTFTTKPEIVTFTTKPEYFTYTTKPEIVTFTTKPEYFTFTTKPKLVTYTTKPQYITYQTSDTITSPQVVAPEVSFNPSFTDVVGKHKHSANCKCLEGKK